MNRLLTHNEAADIPFHEQQFMISNGLMMWHYADVNIPGDRSGYYIVPLCNDEEELA